MKNSTLALLLLPIFGQLAAAPAPAQQAPASTADLAAITQRGQALETYDQAAWHGTDAAQAASGTNPSGLRYYIARKTATGWAVDFGALDAAGTTFLTRIEAQSADGQKFTAQVFATPRSDTGFLVAAAHAVATAEAVFKPVSGFHYNVAVLPNPDKTLYVYLYPGQTDANVFLVGGDERFTISPDGLTILDAHVMHHSVLTIPAPPNGATAVAQVRSVVVADVPQDTDVFHVLARKPAVPDYIAAQGQMYLINIDGSIKYLGPAAKQP
jgi:hypothetical protein